MYQLPQPIRVPLAVVAGLLVSVSACSDTPTDADFTDVSAVLDMGKPDKGDGGSGKPSGGDTLSEFRPTTVTFNNVTGAGVTARIKSDGLGSYSDGVCGVFANIGNFNDARFDPDRNYKKGKHGSCGPRQLVVEFEGADVSAGTFFNIDGINDMAVGDTRTPFAQFNFIGCNTLRFGTVTATHPSAGLWAVTTDGASDKAFCSEIGGDSLAMPFSLTITDGS